MSVKSFIAKLFAKSIYNETQKWAQKPVETQQKVFQDLIRQAKETQLGKDHQFNKIKTYSDFAKQVPIRDYEDLKPYIEEVTKGKENFYGLVNPFILQKLRVQLLGQNTFHLPNNRCLFISKLLEMLF